MINTPQTTKRPPGHSHEQVLELVPGYSELGYLCGYRSAMKRPALTLKLPHVRLRGPAAVKTSKVHPDGEAPQEQRRSPPDSSLAHADAARMGRALKAARAEAWCARLHTLLHASVLVWVLVLVRCQPQAPKKKTGVTARALFLFLISFRGHREMEAE